MSLATEQNTIVQEKAAALREEIQRWLILAGQVEQLAGKTRNAISLGVLEGFLSSARKSIEQVIEIERPRDYPFSPIVESQEITLPANLRPPGKGEPVKSRPGGIRLPDPAYFPKE